MVSAEQAECVKSDVAFSILIVPYCNMEYSFIFCNILKKWKNGLFLNPSMFILAPNLLKLVAV